MNGMNDYDDAENAIAGPSRTYQARMAGNGHDLNAREGIPIPVSEGRPSPDPLSRSYERLNRGPSPSANPSSATTSSSRDPVSPEYNDTATESPFIVRAKFDFQAADPSALSFQTGDVIEVITMLESGWWDGVLGNARGWFPSNFVDVIGEEEEGEEESGAGDEDRLAGNRTNPQVYASPSRRANEAIGRPRTALAEDILGGDDRGVPWQGGEESLEELARSMGVGAEDLAEVDEFALAARRQRERADTLEPNGPSAMSPGRHNQPYLGKDRSGSPQDVLEEDEDDFNAGLQSAAAVRREREGTAGTVRLGSAPHAGQTPLALGRGVSDITPRARKRDSAVSSVRSEGGGEGNDDAWIPCLTPDGQVYYHNTQTGEDSWDLPIPGGESLYEESEMDYHPDPTSSGPPSSVFPPQLKIPDQVDEFRPPPKTTAEIPYPWISRLSDDGQEWYYLNRLTGETTTTLPQSNRRDSLSRVEEDVKAIKLGDVPAPARKRDSIEARRKAMTDWERRSRYKIGIALRPTEKSSLGIMLEVINDTLREVFEAAVAGSAAEEEWSRASDLNSPAGILAVGNREESARDMLSTAHRDLLYAITDLIRAFGYIGPLDPVEEMPRPAWTGDMTLIGSIGVVSANVHAALRSKKLPDNGLSVWQEVMRSASKLRDVITDFPDIATNGAVMGRQLWAWVGVEPIGEVCGGRWGFGEEVRNPLDQGVVAVAERARGAFEAAANEMEEGGELEVMRLAYRFKQVVAGVDIAAAIDIDGEIENSRARAEDIKRYTALVESARTSLEALDQAVQDIDRHTAEIYLALTREDDTSAPLGALGQAISTSNEYLTELLRISTEQRALLAQTPLTGQYGHRSPHYTPNPTPSSDHRRLSVISQASRSSRSSAVDAKRAKARGIEDDFQDSEERLNRSTPDTDDFDRESQARHRGLGKVQRHKRDSSGGVTTPSPISASGSASQVSLAKPGPSHDRDKDRGHAHQPSATSSTTSLAYQKTERTDSDAGSIRGSHRASSLMRGFFGRSRADSDAELREKIEKAERAEKAKEAKNGVKNTRKLAKLLGEEHMPQITAAVAKQQQEKERAAAAAAASQASHTPLNQSIHSQYPSGSVQGHGHSKTNSLSQSQVGIEDRTPGSASFASIPPPLQIETPWYLADDYAPEDIIIDEKGGVRAGTLPALVARLTPHGATDTSFFQAFMLTFRAFTSGDRLFELLSQRYMIQPPSGMDAVEEADWVKSKQTPIRLRVANVLRAWLDVHFMVDQDLPILDRLEYFASTTMIDNIGSEMLSMLSKTLLNLVTRRRRGEDPNQRRIVSGGLLSPPAPLLPRSSSKNLQLTDINPLELARQLTIIEYGNFIKVRSAECLQQLWKVEDETKAANVRNMIHTANKLAAWIGLLILQPKDPKSRATLMKYFIQTAIELRNMNNFSSMAGIIAGLNAAPIDRLKRTKDALSQKTVAMKADLDSTMDSSKNFANYKDMLKTINPPCVPFLGFYLSALTFIEDGNKDIITPAAARAMVATRGMTNSVSSSSLASSSNQGLGINRSPIQTFSSAPSSSQSDTDTATAKEPLINFFKRHLSAEIIRDIQQYQSQPYNLAKCRPVHEFLVSGLERVEAIGDLYERSLLLEPREREEERITRMLHDSGFI